MKSEKASELKNFTEVVRNRILTNLNNIESKLMEILQFYVETSNQNILKQLDIIKKKNLKLKDNLNSYRIPPLLLKSQQKTKNILNQIKVLIFYYELMLIETESLVQDFAEATINVNNLSKIDGLINSFTKSYNRIDALFTQLEGFGNFGTIKKVFQAIGPKVKPLYPKPKKLKKIMKFSKKLDIVKIEKVNLPVLYKKEKKIKKAKLEKSKDEEEESVVYNTFNKLFYSNIKNRLVEIINSLGESMIVKDLGGVIKINKLYNLIKEKDKKLDFSLDDLSKVLKSMKKQGLISNIEEINNLKLITFIPLELSKDPKKLLNAISLEGVETKESLMKRLDWSETRVAKVLEFLMEKGICKSEDGSMMGSKFYFPGLKASND